MVLYGIEGIVCKCRNVFGETMTMISIGEATQSSGCQYWVVCGGG